MQKYDEAKATNTDLKEVIDRAVDVLRKATRDGEVIKGAVNGRQVDVQRVLSRYVIFFDFPSQSLLMLESNYSS